MMQPCKIFAEVSALVGKDFLEWVKKYSDVVSVKHKLCHEIGVECSGENPADVWHIRGDLMGINKSFAFLQALEDQLLSTNPVEPYKFINSSRTNINQCVQQIKDVSEKENENGISSENFDVSSAYAKKQHTSLSNQQTHNIANSSNIGSKDTTQSHTRMNECVQNFSDKYEGNENYMFLPESGLQLTNHQSIRNNQILESSHVKDQIRINTIKTSKDVCLAPSEDINRIICDEPSSNRDSYSHERASAVENFFNFLPDKLAAPSQTELSISNTTDYSICSFHQSQDAFISSEEIFDYENMSLSDLYVCNIPDKIKPEIQCYDYAEKEVTISESNLHTNEISCRSITTDISDKITMRKEELDTLDKMIESITESSTANVGKQALDKDLNEEVIESEDREECIGFENVTEESISPDSNSKNDNDENSSISKSITSEEEGIILKSLDNVSIADIANMESDDDKTRSESHEKVVEFNKPVKGVNNRKSSKKCTKCDKWFKSNIALGRHMKQVHTAPRYQCSLKECEESFTSRSAMESHMGTVHKDLQCGICNVVFQTAEDKDGHNQFCEKLKKNIPTCNICKKRFSSVSNLKKHEKLLHDTGQKVQCSLCKKWYCSLVSLKDHKETIHQIFDCTHCDLKTLTYAEYQSHIKDSHQDIAKKHNGNMIIGKANKFKRPPVKCPHCSKIFASKSNLGHHIRSVHEKKKIICDDCNKTFTTRDHYQRHYKLTHEKIDYPCSMCNVVYPNCVSLAKHQKTKHNLIIMDHCYQCEICGRTFLYQCNLDRHKKRDHQGIKFTCPKCDRKFASKYHMEEHISVDHEGKRLSCAQCEQTFRNKFRLKEHIESEHNDKLKILYSCDNCKKKFKKKSKYKYHKTYHQGTKNCIKFVTPVNADVSNKKIIKVEVSLLKRHNFEETVENDSSSWYECNDRIGKVTQEQINNKVSSLSEVNTIVNNKEILDTQLKVHSTNQSDTIQTTDILKSALETHGIGPNSVSDHFVPVDFHSALNLSHTLYLPQPVPNRPAPPPGMMYMEDDSSSHAESTYTMLTPTAESHNSDMSTMQYSQVVGPFTNPDFL